MIYEVEDDTRNFLTQNKKEFYHKKISRVLKTRSYSPVDKEENLITDPFKEYIYTESTNNGLPQRFRSQRFVDYMQKVRNENPHVKKFMAQNPPDEAYIDRFKMNLIASEYQSIYNKKSDKKSTEQSSKKVILADDCWIPETSTSRSFRNPDFWDKSGLFKTKRFSGTCSSFEVDEKTREILRIRTEDSEYQRIIGKLGKRIIQERFFGPPRPIEPSTEVKKGLNSPRSYCSETLKSVKNNVLSKIF